METTLTTSDQATIAKVRGYIVENFLFGNLESDFGESDSFLAKGIMDSTGILELIEFLEREYGVEVRDDETLPENLDSLANVARFIQKKSAK